MRRIALSSIAVKTPILHCDKFESVLAAIEAHWREHHPGTGEQGRDFYADLARLLNARGFVVDAADGLDVLEHCRRRGLPIVDVLYALEERVRRAGFHGERLGLADYKVNGLPVYVFYDVTRFKTFGDLKLQVAPCVEDVHRGPSQL